MLSTLGRLLRKYRIESGELLKNISDLLGISDSYLSAIEHGKRVPPEGFFDKIAFHYRLDKDERIKLQNACNEAVTSVNINLSGASKERRELGVIFAKRFNSFSDEIILILNTNMLISD